MAGRPGGGAWPHHPVVRGAPRRDARPAGAPRSGGACGDNATAPAGRLPAFPTSPRDPAAETRPPSQAAAVPLPGTTSVPPADTSSAATSAAPGRYLATCSQRESNSGAAATDSQSPDPPDRPRSARTSAAWVNRPAVGNSALARADGAAPGTRARAASQAHDASADGRSAQGAGGDLRGG